MKPDATPADHQALVDIDDALVRLLVRDGRSSYTDLAKQVSLGVDAVQQRVQRLEQTGRIKVVGSVAPAAFGYRTSGMVGLRVGGSAGSVARAAASHPLVHFVASCAGGFDVVAEVVCPDNDHFERTIDDLRAVDGVVSATTLLYLTIERFAYTEIADRPVGRGAPPPHHHFSTFHALDDKDRALVTALRLDGRASYADLAEAADLSYTSARRRTVRLIEDGIVRINTLISPFLSDERAMALVGVRIQGPMGPALTALDELRAIGMITVTTGPYNVLLEITCHNQNEIVDFTGTALAGIPQITGVEVHQYLSIYKLPPQWTGASADPAQ